MRQACAAHLKKKDLRKYADKSAVARAVLAQWNRLNTVIRRQVYSVKVCQQYTCAVALMHVVLFYFQWHGTGGSSRCEGTTKEEAILNMSLREGIVNSEEVKSFYRKYTLEDGNIVCLDAALASEHVRQCINDLKRPRATQSLFKSGSKVCQ